MVPDDFDGDPDALDEILGEWDEWFPIEQGLKSIESLIRVIEADPKISTKFESADYVLADLKSLAASLMIADAEGAQFRLEVG